MGPINIYAVVAPAVLALILVEFIYCLVKRNGYYSFQDSLMGVGTMILAQCINVAVSVAVVWTYGLIFKHFALFHFEMHWYHTVFAYILGDFLFYWFHRAGHRINFFWAIHVPHHSAEELNYAVALRASLTQRAASFLFYWPLAVFGFAPEVIIPLVAVNLVYQLIPHTRVIGRLPKWIESWLNTPYHHRIHHAANEIYWDKNFGGTLIIWDKLFGTYADETDPIFYGVTIHPQSWDPTTLNFHWFTVLWADMKNASRLQDKLKIWFMPPGWRPAHFGPYPKNPVSNVALQIKYTTQALQGSKAYLLMQMVFGLAVMGLVIQNGSNLSALEKVGVSFLLWVAVTFWAFILESKTWAKMGELVRVPLTALFLHLILTTHHFSEALIVLNAVSAFVFEFMVFRMSQPLKSSQSQEMIR